MIPVDIETPRVVHLTQNRYCKVHKFNGHHRIFYVIPSNQRILDKGRYSGSLPPPPGGCFEAWAASASALGYWVDNTPRHVGDAVVFAPGQADADGAYGHVAVLEKINADGSIEISESNAKGLGVISTRTFSAAEAGKFQYVHY